jgi:hypothetical protein
MCICVDVKIAFLITATAPLTESLQPIASKMPFIATWLRARASQVVHSLSKSTVPSCNGWYQHNDAFAASAAAIEDLSSTPFLLDSVPFLLLRARAQYELGQVAGACALYARIRSIDPCCLDGLSYYAGMYTCGVL